MKHIISTSTLISFLVACSLNIVCTFAMVMSLYPLDEDIAATCVPFILFCNAWVIIAAAYMIRRGRRTEKKARRDRLQAQIGILRVLDEKGPMSKEDLEGYDKYRERIGKYTGEYIGGRYWYSYYPLVDFERKETPLHTDGHIVCEDLDYHLKKLQSNRLIEWRIEDGKYQLSQHFLQWLVKVMFIEQHATADEKTELVNGKASINEMHRKIKRRLDRAFDEN